MPTARHLLLMTGLAGCAADLGPSPVCLAGAHLTSHGACAAAPAPEHRLPFRRGYKTRVTQGFHGGYTHKNEQAFAVDFECAVGDPIVATRDGVVWITRDDSRTGCSDPKCNDDANFIAIDHGDGTISEYAHLREFGVFVQPGDQVCQGQLIGLCGMTGHTTGAHLHYALNELSPRTIPVRFAEVRSDRMGLAIPDATYTSANQRPARCEPTTPSSLGAGAFAHHGILLDDAASIVWAQDGPKQVFEGSYFGDEPMVALSHKPFDAADADPWNKACVPVEHGRFRVELEVAGLGTGVHLLFLTGADAECETPSWAWSYKIRVDAPTLQLRPPQDPTDRAEPKIARSFDSPQASRR